MDARWYGLYGPPAAESPANPIDNRDYFVSTSNSTSMFKLLRRLWRALHPRRRVHFAVLLGLMLISAAAELVTLGSVVPFLVILTGSAGTGTFSALFGLTPGQPAPFQTVLLLGGALAVAAIASAGVRILLLWATTRLSFLSGAELGVDILRRTLCQPYSVHVYRTSSEVISGITTKVHGVVFGELIPAANLINGIILGTTIGIAMLVFSPVVGCFIIVVLGAAYVIISRLTNARLARNGSLVARHQTDVLRSLQDALGSIRDILLHGSQEFHVSQHQRLERELQLAQGRNAFISQSPRYLMEAVAILAIVGISIVLSNSSGAFASAVPILGALAVGGQRMLPALQQAYGGWTSMIGSKAILSEILDLIEQPLPEDTKRHATPATFERSLKLDSIRFRFNEATPWVLDGVNLEVRKGKRIAIVGKTGSGKSTLLDIILGLLPPTSGSVSLDDHPLNTLADVRSWQANIAHVPQAVHIADGTIADNIAFGTTDRPVPEDLKEAARKAQALTFIESRPDGFLSSVGERGRFLSGGQRQRIGLARAFYRHPKVLVMDEPTSALDRQTEAALMDVIRAMDREITLIVVTHKVEHILDDFDEVWEVKDGHIYALAGQSR